MKRFATWMLIVSLLVAMFALTACNKQEAQPTVPAETTGTQPTTAPTEAPTAAPTDPTDAPTDPTQGATEATTVPTEAPTQAPTQKPTQAPTQKPTQAPTQKPTQAPTQKPTQAPTQKPTQAPTQKPTQAPTQKPTQAPTQPADAITITAPTGEVYGYVENARNYLLSGGDRVDRYKNKGGMKSAAKAIDITWTANFTADSFTVRYGTNANLSDAKEITVSGTSKSVSVYNLLKSATYYVEVSARNGSGKTVVATSSFTTSSIGPRVMHIDTLYNVRDLGGYKTSDGKVTKQGMIFRGDALIPCKQSEANLSDAGKAFMSQELGIKLEIDLRTPGEAQYNGTTSVIPGARLEYVNISAYNEIFNNPDKIAQIFKMLADSNNYPIYIHCTGGADRTGTVAFMINALLGVSYDELVQDYEFTSFSIYGTRDTQGGEYANKFAGIENTLYYVEGKNWSEKVENYLLNNGVTQAEINNIKTIMKG